MRRGNTLYVAPPSPASVPWLAHFAESHTAPLGLAMALAGYPVGLKITFTADLASSGCRPRRSIPLLHIVGPLAEEGITE